MFICGWCLSVIFFFKQKTAYEMRISDWSSDVCSSDLALRRGRRTARCIWWITRGNCCTPLLPRKRRSSRVKRRRLDRKSVVEGKSVSVRVDLGGRRIIKKKHYSTINMYHSRKLIEYNRVILRQIDKENIENITY